MAGMETQGNRSEELFLMFWLVTSKNGGDEKGD